jgi:heterodisulfide reductase subunit D
LSGRRDCQAQRESDQSESAGRFFFNPPSSREPFGTVAAATIAAAWANTFERDQMTSTASGVVPIRPTYTTLFRTGRVLGDLLKRPEFSWVTEPRLALKEADWVIHQSCNAAFTPFIADVTQQALALVGQKVPVIGGSESCCGEFHVHFGDQDLGEIAARKAQQGFTVARPRTVVSICPDCDSIFEKMALADRKYACANISSLIVEMLPVLVPLMKPLRKKVILHSHHATALTRNDAVNMEKILSAIPGLEIIPAQKSDGPGVHCQTVKPMHPDDQAAMFKEARERGADAIAVPYHSCYRQHIKMQLGYGVETCHYIALLGQALGLEVYEEFKRLRLLDDVDAVTREMIERAPPGRYAYDDMKSVVARGIFC